MIEPQVTKPDSSYRTQDLPLEQVKALWGGEFPWVNGHDSFQNPRAYTYHTEEGEPVYAVIEIGDGDVGFTVTILPQYPQGGVGRSPHRRAGTGQRGGKRRAGAHQRHPAFHCRLHKV